jgi:hypothetical protein
MSLFDCFGLGFNLEVSRLFFGIFGFLDLEGNFLVQTDYKGNFGKIPRQS